MRLDVVMDLDRAMFAAAPTSVAPLLLGLHVQCGGVSVRITEVEAYEGATDPGSHGFRGQTPRNVALFGPPATAYVYISYGIHRALNVVCGRDGESGGCLLRAGEVVSGYDMAMQRRQAGSDRIIAAKSLARGPGNLGQALGVDLELNGADLLDPMSFIQLHAPDGWQPAPDVMTGPRVGVSGLGGNGENYPWRFWLPREPSVSAYRPGRNIQ